MGLLDWLFGKKESFETDVSMADNINVERDWKCILRDEIVEPNAKHAIDKAKNVNAIDTNGKTPLLYVIRNCKKEDRILELVGMLIELKADVNLADKEGKTPLHYCVERLEDVERCIEILKVLINAGADVNFADKEGKTLLHYCIERLEDVERCIEIFKVLINAGADVNFADKEGKTPLHDCIESLGDVERLKILNFLLEAGADVNAETALGRTPWMHLLILYDEAASSKESPMSEDSDDEQWHDYEAACVEAITRLAEAGAKLGTDRAFDDLDLILYNIKAPDALFRLIRFFVSVEVPAESFINYACSYLDFSVVSWLIEAGASINTKNEYGHSCLECAIENSTDPERIRFLIDKGAEVINEHAKLAAGNNHNDEILRILMEKTDTDVNEVFYGGETLLMSAAISNVPKIVRALIEMGADVNAKDKWGKTPLFYAIMGAKLDNAQVLYYAGADMNVRNIAGSNALIKAIEQRFATLPLLAVLCQMNVCNIDGKNALIRALHCALAKLSVRDNYDKNMLIRASEPLARLQIIDFLLLAGVDVNAKDNEGKTPLMHVALNSHLDIRDNEGKFYDIYYASICSDLLKAGADVEVLDNTGGSAFHYSSALSKTYDLIMQSRLERLK